MTARAHVIITTYENPPYLQKAIRGYLRQTAPAFHLTVADDGSGPDTAALVRSMTQAAAEVGVTLNHVRQEDQGYRRARVQNEALRQVQEGTLLIFSDGDCVPPARFVERHLAAHAPRSFHVAGAVRLSREATERLTDEDIDAGRHEQMATARDRRDLAHRARKSRWGMLLRRKNRPKILGLNIAMDRPLFEDLNGFDERFVTWGLEDSDLRDRAMRLRPRPAVKVLYGVNDVVHLWHPTGTGGRQASRAYYETARPIRCEEGLVHSDAPIADSGP